MNTPGDKQSILIRHKEGPTLHERAVADLREVHLDAVPSEGGWTIRQVVHHIVDGDNLRKSRIKSGVSVPLRCGEVRMRSGNKRRGSRA